MFAKILALIAAIKAHDWATVLRIIGEIIDGLNAGTISDAEIEECHVAFKAMQK